MWCRNFSYSGSQWKLAVFHSPGIWARAVFSGIEYAVSRNQVNLIRVMVHYLLENSVVFPLLWMGCSSMLLTSGPPQLLIWRLLSPCRVSLWPKCMCFTKASKLLANVCLSSLTAWCNHCSDECDNLQYVQGFQTSLNHVMTENRGDNYPGLKPLMHCYLFHITANCFRFSFLMEFQKNVFAKSMVAYCIPVVIFICCSKHTAASKMVTAIEPTM